MTNILITGGSEGIGLAVARLLAAESGTRLTLVARNEQKLKAAVAALPGQGHGHVVADLSRRPDTDALAQRLASRHYDVLINNAGVGLYGRFADLPLEDQLKMMRLNMESVVVLSQAYLRQAKRGDALVNTASFLGYSPLPGAAVYSATKAFVAALSETLWWENKKKGIYVLGFSPGVTSTNFHAAAGTPDARFPKILLQSADGAAKDLVRALRKRAAPRAMGGVVTRLMLSLQRLLPRKVAINMMGVNAPI
ncbi:MAG TPA: SDR family NAD(P)-dependent oxidoreductase [Gemmatimonadales bacterium]|nr:SDR family NAD(P)-dependent oxidoreductase [Gemmatimonadales bacterium]